MSIAKPKSSFRVLVIDDDQAVREVINSRLTRRGHQVLLAADGTKALDLYREQRPHVAITDLRMPGLSGFEVLKAMAIPTIIITGHGDKESAIQAVECGAFAFFEKPFDLNALEFTVERAAERHHLEVEKQELLDRLAKLCKLQNRELELVDAKNTNNFMGHSPAMQDIQNTLKLLAAKTKATLLLLGDTGTGKEVAARELHRLSFEHHSERAPFLALNCASIPTELLESELYGHEKGSFSGATNTRIGLAEAAREGTLFLDEIGDMDPRHQAKLLRLLQERSFRRVGSNREIQFEGRIVAATHRKLKELVAKGSFREDLYYRLSVVTVSLPPLRERPDDLVGLANFLAQKWGLKGLAPHTQAMLTTYLWPGNIRELSNWVERSYILGLYDSEKYINAAIPSIGDQSNSEAPKRPLSFQDLKSEILEQFSRDAIVAALNENQGNISKTAKAMGMDRKTLGRKIKILGLDAKKRAA